MNQLMNIDNDFTKEIANDTLTDDVSNNNNNILNESNSNSDSSRREIFLDIIDK